MGSRPTQTTEYTTPKKTFALTQVPQASFDRLRAYTEGLASQSNQYMNALRAQADMRKARSDMENWNIYGASLPIEDRYSKMARGVDIDAPGRTDNLANKVFEWADDATRRYADALAAVNAPENQFPEAEVDPRVWEGMGKMPKSYTTNIKKGPPKEIA